MNKEFLFTHENAQKWTRDFVQMVRELSYQKKQVKLVSGRDSDFYIDMKQTILNARGLWLASHLILEKLVHEVPRVKGVGGLTMGADPLSSGVSLASAEWRQPLHALYIRKEPKGHGTQVWLEGTKNFKEGDSIYILEDVVTTGGSTIKSVERVQMGGFKVAGVIACVDREEGGADNIRAQGLKFHALLTRTQILAV